MVNIPELHAYLGLALFLRNILNAYFKALKWILYPIYLVSIHLAGIRSKNKTINQDNDKIKEKEETKGRKKQCHVEDDNNKNELTDDLNEHFMNPDGNNENIKGTKQGQKELDWLTGKMEIKAENLEESIIQGRQEERNTKADAKEILHSTNAEQKMTVKTGKQPHDNTQNFRDLRNFIRESALTIAKLIQLDVKCILNKIFASKEEGNKSFRIMDILRTKNLFRSNYFCLRISKLWSLSLTNTDFYDRPSFVTTILMHQQSFT